MALLLLLMVMCYLGLRTALETALESMFKEEMTVIHGN